MEIWDVYDQDRNLTGKTIQRGSVFGKGEYHLVTHVCIFNQNNEMLIQQRQPWKKGRSNMWGLTVGGSALSGETSKRAGERETFEEIDISKLTLQYEEVQRVKWANKDEVMQLVNKGVFINYWFTELLFDMRKQRGAHLKV